MSANTYLLERETRHQIFIQRYGGGVYNDLKPVLRKLRRDLLARLATAPTEYQSMRITALLSEIDQLVVAAGRELGGQLEMALTEFAQYEAEFQQRLLSGAITTQATLPTAEALAAAVTSAPTRMVDQSETIPQMVARFTARAQSAVRTAIQGGYVEGATVQSMTREVSRLVSTRTARQAEALVRTAVNHIGDVAKSEVYKANADILEGERYSATLDSRTTIRCAELDGEVFPVGQGPSPPQHYNCLTGDTLVSTCSTVANIYKRRYKGAMVNITTKTGRTLRITPNHPVLTVRGWVAAGQLNTSDKLIPVEALNVLIYKNYKDSVEATFSDLFSAINIASDSSLIANRPSSSEDFHGDIAVDAKVEVISTDSLSWSYVRKVLSENIKNNRLKLGSVAYSTLHCFSAFDKFRLSLDSTSGRIMSRFRKFGYLLRSCFGHSGELLFRSITQLPSLLKQESCDGGFRAVQANCQSDPVSANTRVVSTQYSGLFRVGKMNSLNRCSVNPCVSEDSSNRLIADAEDFSNPANSELFDCSKADDVIDLFVSEVDLHVYNLENKDNWYLSNGIITHNCRSVRVPVVKPEFQVPGFEGERASVSGPVSSRTTYQSFLRRQSVEFQNEVLGETRAKLFREGMPIDRFTDDAGRVLTLDQLRAREGITLG